MSQKRIKLPKRIAGVKIPKVVRKGPVVDFLNSSGGQVLLAEAVMLAGGLFSTTSPGGGSGEGRRGSVGDASARLAHAFGEAVRAFRAALADESFVAPREHLDDENVQASTSAATADAVHAGETSEEGAKKKRAPRPQPEDLQHAPAP